MKMYVASGKSIPPELLREGQNGILITDELKQFMESGLPGLANVRPHDMKHTFGRRLRATGVARKHVRCCWGTRMVISRALSAPELGELLEASNRVCGGESRKSPAMTLLKRKIA